MKKVTNYIQDALFALLKEKSLEDITINELVKKAGVCRASFYRNFYYLSDVLQNYVDSLFNRILKTNKIDPNHIEHHMQYVYEVLYEEKGKLTVLEKHNLLHLLDKGYEALCLEQVKALNSYRNDYQIAYFTGASAFVIRNWIKKGFRESPKELANITVNNILGTRTIGK